MIILEIMRCWYFNEIAGQAGNDGHVIPGQADNDNHVIPDLIGDLTPKRHPRPDRGSKTINL